jgi:uncharacterized protein involved in response to NO
VEPCHRPRHIAGGGRLIPSFTRNYLAKEGKKSPRPAGRLDQVAFWVMLTAGAGGAILPEEWTPAVACTVTDLCQFPRLLGWHGFFTYREAHLLVLRAVLMVAELAWIPPFCVFLVEYTPMLPGGGIAAGRSRHEPGPKRPFLRCDDLAMQTRVVDLDGSH